MIGVEAPEVGTHKHAHLHTIAGLDSETKNRGTVQVVK